MADEANHDQAGKGQRSGRKSQLLIVALLMLVEGVGIIVVARAMHSEPDSAQAAETGGKGDGAGGAGEDLAEIELAECRPTNRITGKLISFQIRVSALVDSAGREQTERMIKAKKERIQDRINFVIRSAEPAHLAEPGLETIKRRIKAELDELFDDDRIIRAVLVPEFLQS